MGSEREFLLHAIWMGVFITFVYDFLRIFRRVLPHGSFFVSLEDLIFWVYCAEEVFLLMYHESDGTLRWFAVIGAMVGMFLYKKLVSPLFVRYLSWLLSKLLEILGRVLNWICRPFRLAWGKAGRTVHKAGGRIHHFIGRMGRAIKKKLTFFIKMLKITLKA